MSVWAPNICIYYAYFIHQLITANSYKWLIKKLTQSDYKWMKPKDVVSKIRQDYTFSWKGAQIIENELK